MNQKCHVIWLKLSLNEIFNWIFPIEIFPILDLQFTGTLCGMVVSVEIILLLLLFFSFLFLRFSFFLPFLSTYVPTYSNLPHLSAKFILRIVRSYCTVFKALARVSPFGPLLAPLIVGCEDSVKMCTFCALSTAEKKDPSKKPKLSTDSLVEGLKRMVDGFKKVWAEVRFK